MNFPLEFITDTLNESVEEMINLDKNGYIYKEKGLPENRFLKALKNTNKKSTKAVSTLLNKSSIDKEELNICIGLLKKKVAIEIVKNKELEFFITDQGKRILSSKSLEEKFLEHNFPVNVIELKDEYKFAFDDDSSMDFIFAVGCTYAVSAASRAFRFTPEYRIPQHNKKAASELEKMAASRKLLGN